MATDLTIRVDDRPGAIAHVGEALGLADVNAAGGCCVSGTGASVELHVVVEDVAGARQALEDAEVEIANERDVLVVDVDDIPGELGRVTRRIADAGVNIEVFYLATGTRLVLGTDDDEAARAALG